MSETKSCEDYTLAELGQWVHLLVKRAVHKRSKLKRKEDLMDAQNYLDIMQARVLAARTAMPAPASTEPPAPTEPLPEPLETAPSPDGPPRDEAGNITRISSQSNDPGYDPEIGQKEGLAIFCNGKHVPTAHTADTKLGLVRYYEKNDQGRIKTLEMYGLVEIRGL